MIITKQKDIQKILGQLKGKDRVFVVGCAACATKCATGGEEQVRILAEELAKNQKKVTGTIVLDTPCDMRIVKKELLHNEKAGLAESLVLLSCGAGVQSIAQVCPERDLVPALDTLFLGSIERLGNFNQYCSLCGDCIIDETAGLCPVTRCAKALVNGPCGGAVNGKCEVNSGQDCVWILIYEKLQKNPTNIKKYRKIKSNASISKPQRIKTR
ncbi:MAG: methylenetetrahydrofolate reductase C-terminal domain-containing protein [bacterium]|nr:methylenetetrahydrofolate reductase C-terminal domain-containing protein [bacterium]MDD5354493.1 methylenetetrahydrofolate reductase C-terminal domain-containing protein [bacterium]MDD5755996.1 methylenetetrahydrofolate reductase C-terminal domain-containing protein [bacterium]